MIAYENEKRLSWIEEDAHIDHCFDSMSMFIPCRIHRIIVDQSRAPRRGNFRPILTHVTYGVTVH